jgi:hypothetical protein
VTEPANERRGFVRENSLTLVFILLFVLALAGQALVGFWDFNEQQQAHHEATYTFGRYLLSSDFGVDVMENWQSEFLQFSSFILLAIWLRQRGSTESKKLDEDSIPSDEDDHIRGAARPDSPYWASVGGVRTLIFSNSLLLLMTFFWLASWGTQAVTGWRVYNDDQSTHKQPEVSFSKYLDTAEFWNRSMQNWQSEFLAVASMSIFSVYLRQRGSPESKPVGEPHLGGTGTED